MQRVRSSRSSLCTRILHDHKESHPLIGSQDRQGSNSRNDTPEPENAVSAKGIWRRRRLHETAYEEAIVDDHPMSTAGDGSVPKQLIAFVVGYRKGLLDSLSD